MYRSVSVGIPWVMVTFLGCGDYGGYAPSDRDNCVPCRERLPAEQCPAEDCCRYLSDDPYVQTAPEAQARADACSRQEKGPFFPVRQDQ